MKPALFLFGTAPVRILMENGDPWFVAADVAAAMGIAQVASTIRDYPPDEAGMRLVHVSSEGRPGQRSTQDMTVLSEPGLYRLIFQSRVPGAEPFKKWVFGEVLPSIRKTGRYAPGEPPAGEQLTELVKLLQMNTRIAARVATLIAGPADRGRRGLRLQKGDAIEAAGLTVLQSLAAAVPDGATVEFSMGQMEEAAAQCHVLHQLTGEASSPRTAMGKRLARLSGRDFTGACGRPFYASRRHTEKGSVWKLRCLRESAGT